MEYFSQGSICTMSGLQKDEGRVDTFREKVEEGL